MILNFRIKCLVTVFFLLPTLFSCAKSSSISRVNVTSEGIAIKGYDPVAYFTGQGPLKGNPEFEYIWNGARWRFSSAANRESFMQEPEKYSPRYGGYCAYAVSQGKIADIDPAAWTIFEGRLYLNLNKDVQKLWEKDIIEYIRLADKNWPRMSGNAP